MPKESGNHVLLNVRGRWNNRRKRECRIGSDGDRHLHLSRGMIVTHQARAARRPCHNVHRRRCVRVSTSGRAHAFAIVLCRYFLPLPMHAGGLAVVHLHAIHPHVALPGFRIPCNHTWQCDEAPAIFRPALQNGIVQQRELTAPDHLLARATLHFFRKESPHIRQHRQHLYLVYQALRTLYVHEHANAVGNFIQGIDVQRQIHAPRRAKLIDQHLVPRMAFHVLE